MSLLARLRPGNPPNPSLSNTTLLPWALSAFENRTFPGLNISGLGVIFLIVKNII